MNMWKKITVGVVSAALAAAPVMADGARIEYGMNVEAGDAAINLDYSLLEDAEENTALSAVFSMKQEGMDITMSLDDIIRGNKGHVYLNVGKVVNCIETLTGATDLMDSFGALISGEWVEVPLPEFDKIVVEGATVAEEAAVPTEINEEMMADLMAIAEPFTPEEADGSLVITINDEKLIQAAGALDNVLATYKDEIAGMAAKTHQPSADAVIDVKPAIQGYIDAIAEGMIMVKPEMDKESAVEMINSTVDAFVGELMEQVHSANAGTTQITPEMLETVKVQEAVEESLAEADVDGTLTLTENGCDGTIKVTSGTETEEMTLKAEAIENGFQIRFETDGQTLSVEYTLTDNEFWFYLDLPEEEVSASLLVNWEEADAVTSGNASLLLSSAGEEVSIGGYFSADTAADVEAIEIPADAVDGYEVVKTIAAGVFAAGEAVEEQPEATE